MSRLRDEAVIRPELFAIRRTGPGTLSIMARPRGGDWLEDEMTSLSAAGVRVLASLLSDAEASELGLSAEGDAAKAAGLMFYRLPTPDRHVPEQAASLALAMRLRLHLAEDAGVVVHCRHGIGRASTLAAVVLVLEGTEPRRAWELIASARGLPVPDTDAQRDFIFRLHRQDDPPGERDPGEGQRGPSEYWQRQVLAGDQDAEDDRVPGSRGQQAGDG